MSSKSRRTTTIIRRHVTLAEATRHGGAWKVAYADFVTALMAFFLLMWLLAATTERQRIGLADYFNPTVIHQRSGGTDAFDGEEQPVSLGTIEQQGLNELAREIETQLNGIGAESMQKKYLLRHVVTRISDEGLVIELGDLAGEPLFEGETAVATRILRDLAGIITPILAHVDNDIALAGHVHAFPEALIHPPAWDLSGARSQAVRQLIEDAGLTSSRFQRVVSHGDREARSDNPMDPQNNRIELILLRS